MEGRFACMARGSRLILVDTTVWIDFFRGSETPQSRAFQALIADGELVVITDIILTEILRGTGGDKEYATVKQRLASFPCLTARAPKTFIHAADLYRSCRKKGVTVRSTVDCLIAAVCIENKASLLHHDSDFDYIAKCSNLKILDPKSV
jgi:predicted nucleic acid-binding protein